MVSSSQKNAIYTIIARPDHSSTWRNNLWLLAAVAVPSLGAAIGFAFLGAWPILPFAGAELISLGAALYYVNWKLQYRHVITLDQNSVQIDIGHYAPRRSWHFNREESSLAVTPEQHPWEGPKLAIHNREQTVEIGTFLNREDRLLLLSLVRKELKVGTHSAEGSRQL
ncbi:MAG: DUF2244 domain-containing protein [Luminiphilus sp.]|nr:DUF2244 domain-containing protein [Luminiphilus sp.]